MNATDTTLLSKPVASCSARCWRCCALATRIRALTIRKADKRYNPPRTHDAIETEALGQEVLVEILRKRLDQLLPDTRGNEHERAVARAKAVELRAKGKS
jgi:hypothetical protein